MRQFSPGDSMTCPYCRASVPDSAFHCPSCGHDQIIRPGVVLSGRYEILASLGSGGMGVVFKAHDRELDEVVAVKVLRSDVASNPTMAMRFRSEIKLARKVRHPNVCAIHEYGQDGECRYIVMEHVAGKNLREALQRQGRLPPAEALEVATQVASGLEAIHSQEIVHRDLKTTNLMRTTKGVVRLMDFGIAKRVAADAGPGATAVGLMVGTPDYMSPEQVRGEAVDGRSDLYSLGIVLYELLTGKLPFHASTPMSIALSQLHDAPPLDGPDAALIPAHVVPVLRRALAKDRDLRFSSAAEMGAALQSARTVEVQNWCSDRPTSTLSRTAVRVTPPPIRRATVLAGAAVALTDEPRPVPVTAPTSSPTQRPTLRPTLRPTPHPTPHLTPTPAMPAARRSARARTTSPLRLTVTGSGLILCLVLGWYLAGGGRRGPEPSSTPPHVSVPRATASPGAPSPSAVPGPTTAATPRSVTATPPPSTPTPQPTARASGPPTGPDLADLDRLAERDPEAALAAAVRARASSPDARGLEERAVRYRSSVVHKLVASGRAALDRAAAGGGGAARQEAGRLFRRALALDASSEAAREGLSVAERPAPAPGISFVLSDTRCDDPADATPPGFRAPGPGIQVRPTHPRIARAQLILEAVPESIVPGGAYGIRYHVYNRSADPLTIAGVRIRNETGGSAVSGGPVAPLTRTAPPAARTLLVETQGTWNRDAATDWQTTLEVTLDDGSVCGANLRTRR